MYKFSVVFLSIFSLLLYGTVANFSPPEAYANQDKFRDIPIARIIDDGKEHDIEVDFKVNVKDNKKYAYQNENAEDIKNVKFEEGEELELEYECQNRNDDCVKMNKYTEIYLVDKDYKEKEIVEIIEEDNDDFNPIAEEICDVYYNGNDECYFVFDMPEYIDDGTYKLVIYNGNEDTKRKYYYINEIKIVEKSVRVYQNNDNNNDKDEEEEDDNKHDNDDGKHSNGIAIDQDIDQENECSGGAICENTGNNVIDIGTGTEDEVNDEEYEESEVDFIIDQDIDQENECSGGAICENTGNNVIDIGAKIGYLDFAADQSIEQENECSGGAICENDALNAININSGAEEEEEDDDNDEDYSIDQEIKQKNECSGGASCSNSAQQIVNIN